MLLGLWLMLRVSILHESLLVPVLMYGSETVISKEKKRSRIRAVHMDNLKGLLGIMRIYKVSNARTTELCGVMKGLMKAFSNGSAMWREWRTTRLPRGYM